MDLRLSCSLWVHGSRTSALMSYDDPCNCGQHIPVCLRVLGQPCLFPLHYHTVLFPLHQLCCVSLIICYVSLLLLD
jgi:hypothetical protein